MEKERLENIVKYEIKLKLKDKELEIENLELQDAFEIILNLKIKDEN